MYHVTGQAAAAGMSWQSEAVQLAGYQVPVEPVNASEDTLSSMRPSYSVLGNMMLRISDMRLLPHWKEMLEAYEGWRTGSQRRAEGKDGIGYGK